MTTTTHSKSRLGNGLDELLNGSIEHESVAAAPRVPLEKIQENPFQPRKTFDCIS